MYVVMKLRSWDGAFEHTPGSFTIGVPIKVTGSPGSVGFLEVFEDRAEAEKLGPVLRIETVEAESEERA